MKQVLQNLRNGETLVVDVPVPTPQAGEVLVRNQASLLSAGTERMVVEFAGKSLLGKARARPDQVRQVLDKARREGPLSTLEAVFNRLDQPMPLGYSSAGIVAGLGPDVSGFRLGQRVACAGGGYAVHAEYVSVPVNLLAPIPDHVDFDSAAFTTLGAIALHGFRLAEVQIGERLAVIGLGLLGLLTAGIASAAGCVVLGVDLDPYRVELAQKFGATGVLRMQAEQAAPGFTRGRGCDAVLICADTSSNDPLELAGIIARDRARVVAVGAVGLQVPRKIFFEKELVLVNSRSYGPGRYDPQYEEGGLDYPLGYVRWTEGRNLEAIVDLLASGRLDVRPLISHRYPIDQAPKAYDLILGKSTELFLGVLLNYPGDPSSSAQQDSIPGRHEQARVASGESSRELLEMKEKISPVLLQHDRVALGVLGAGNFASAVLLPAVKDIPGVEMVGIISASGASAQVAASRFGFKYADSDPERLLNDPQVNTLAILTRHHLHARQVLVGLSAGKHVFCEKPLALHEAELVEIETFFLNNASSSPLPILTVGFNRRFAPLSNQMQAFFAGRSEPLVAHYRVNAGWLPLTHWTQDPKQGGGRILGEACHFVDCLAFLVGEPPVEVRAQALPDVGCYREDNAILTFTFPDGSLGTVTYLANGDKSFPKERLEAFCAGQVAVLDDFRSLEMVSSGHRKIVRARLRQDKGHQAECQAFVTAIRSGGPPPIPYRHLFGVTRATFAALQALRSGKTVSIA